MLGGVVYYAGRVFERLGLEITFITKAANKDLAEISEQLRGKTVTLRCRGSERTTVFENIYLGTDLSRQRTKAQKNKKMKIGRTLVISCVTDSRPAMA